MNTLLTAVAVAWSGWGQTDLPADKPDTAPLLIICNRDGAEVTIDGRPVGRTPLDAVDLSVGPHVVQIRAEGVEPFLAQVEVLAHRFNRLEARLSTQVILPPLAIGEPGIETGRTGHQPIITRWWFWSIVAALGAAIVITGVQLSGGDDFVPGGELPPTDTSDWNRL